MKTEESDTETRDSADTTPALFRLKLLTGLHAGAERDCHEGDMLIVGTHADCDVILADADVAERHCVIGFNKASLVVRPIATGVSTDNLPLARGQTHSLPLFQPIRLGSVELIGGPAQDPVWSDRYAGLTAPVPMRHLLRTGSGLPLAATVLAAIALSTAIALSASTREPETEPVSPRASLAMVIEELDLDEAFLDPAEGVSLRITGTVPDQAALEELRRRATNLAPGAQVAVRVGSDMAGDVREALRMEGIRAQTRYVGNGNVQVTGYFPDPERVDTILKSRNVLQISGLNDVQTKNLTDPPAPEPVADAEPFKPYSIVPDPEPYVRGADGSVYYVGATIPSIGKLIDIDGQTLYIDSGHNTRILQLN